MPELPEVETLVRDLRYQGIVGRKIKQAHVFWPKTISGMSPQAFCRRIKGQIIHGVDRYGKYITLHLTRDFLLIHLRMTGRFELKSEKALQDAHVHAILRFENGQDLRFRDTRKFGRFFLVKDPADVLGRLGPDPVKTVLSPKFFGQLLVGKKRRLKALLLDQTFLAGIGNIYADEILWETRLHPEIRSDCLRPSQIQALRRAIDKILRRGIRNSGTSLGKSSVNFHSLGGAWGRNQQALRVFRKTGQPCPRCKTAIRRIIVAQRSTHFCPHCQKT